MRRKERVLLFSKIAAAGALLLLALSPLAPANEREGASRAAAPDDPIAPTPGGCSPRGARPSATTRSATRCSGAGSSAPPGRRDGEPADGPRRSGSRSTRRPSPRRCSAALKRGQVDLDDPAVTAELLRLNAVVGVTGFFNPDGSLRSVGITCALCHSTVDDSLAPGIGQRLDGWANRDLNVGAIVSLAPDLQPFAEPPGRGRGDGAHRPPELGAGQVRRRADPRRQGVPPGRQDRRPR